MEQEGLQIRAAQGISNQGQIGAEISNRGKEITNGEKRDYKPGKEFQIGVGITNRGKEISNRGRVYQSGQERLPMETVISNRGKDYKSVQSNITCYILYIPFSLHIFAPSAS